MVYDCHNRAKYLLIFHVIFVVKYRKPLLQLYGTEMKTIFTQIAVKSAFRINELEVDRDHIHLLVQTLPSLSPAQLVRRLKQESTRLIWQAHPELNREFWKKRVFWSDGYFCCTIGNASLQTIQEYINNQG